MWRWGWLYMEGCWAGVDEVRIQGEVALWRLFSALSFSSRSLNVTTVPLLMHV